MKYGYKVGIFAGLLLTQWLWDVSLADASVVYTYTGNPFTLVYSPYTTADLVTLSFTLAGPLGDNFAYYGKVTPLSFTAYDGTQTLSNTTPDVTLYSIALATGSTGAIDEWQIEITVGNPEDLGSEIYTRGLYANGAGADAATNPECIMYTDTCAVNYNDLGQWTMTATPLAPSLPLFGTGLGVLGFFGWRRKRNARGITA